MRYKIKAEREDNLLNMLSSNVKALGEYRRLHDEIDSLRGLLPQSFGSAAKAFRAIDAPTRGVIVPYGEGKDEGEDIISGLCGAFEPEKNVILLRKAQQYTVNIYPHIWEKMVANSILKEVQEGTDIWHLLPGYYSEEFGLSDELVSKLEALHL